MAEKELNVLTLRMSDGNVIKFEHYDTMVSTAALAREYAKAGYPDRYVVFTENQQDTSLTGSRLREGETGHGVFMSVILRPNFFSSQAGFLGAMSALALIRGLEEHTKHPLGIGWVSDLFCDGVRIGGCAAEGKIDNFRSYEYLVVHFAVRLEDAVFPPRLSDMLRQVFEEGAGSISMMIAKGVLDRFFTLYADIKNPSASFMDAYRQKMILRGTHVRVNEDGHRLLCRVVDVDPADGRLIVLTSGGRELRIANRANVTVPPVIHIHRSN